MKDINTHKIIIAKTALIIFLSVTAYAAQWSRETDIWIEELSRLYNVPPPLTRSVIKVESNFSYCVSPRGAVGFMQLMPATAEYIGITDIWDPLENLKGGILYLSMLLEKYDGNIPLALAAYNAGPTAVSRNDGIPPYRETRNFILRVLRHYDRYSEEEYILIPLP